MEGFHFVVFNIDEEVSSLLRGQKCEVWKASISLCLESMKRDPLRCAVRDARCGRLPLRCICVRIMFEIKYGGFAHLTHTEIACGELATQHHVEHRVGQIGTHPAKRFDWKCCSQNCDLSTFQAHDGGPRLARFGFRRREMHLPSALCSLWRNGAALADYPEDF